MTVIPGYILAAWLVRGGGVRGWLNLIFAYTVPGLYGTYVDPEGSCLDGNVRWNITGELGDPYSIIGVVIFSELCNRGGTIWYFT